MSKAPATVAVLYCAEYGFADRLSQTIARCEGVVIAPLFDPISVVSFLIAADLQGHHKGWRADRDGRRPLGRPSSTIP